MKRSMQRWLMALFCLFLLLACQRLVERPQPSELQSNNAVPPPLMAVMLKAPADLPAERLNVQTAQETPLRRGVLPVGESAVCGWVNTPVCDGNGTPLADRSYVRTVYTACRLSETSG